MSAPADTSNRLGFAEVRIAAAGQWVGIVRALGVNLPNTTRHTACPGCGGKDRFRLEPDFSESGRWICGGGGDMQSGDGFGLLCHVHGWTLAESLRAVADYLGMTRMDDTDRAALRQQASRLAAQMAEDAERKAEQARTDSNLLVMLEDLIDAIRHRQYLQRQIGGINGRVTWQPSVEEVQAAQELNTAILEAYAHTEGEGYV